MHRTGRAGARRRADRADRRDRCRKDDARRGDRAARRRSGRPVDRATGAAEARVDGRFVIGGDEVVLLGDPRRRPVAGLRRRTAGDCRDARHDHRWDGRPARPARPPGAAVDRRPTRDALDRFAGIDLGPLQRRGRRSPSSTPSWRRSVGTSGRGPARSTCSATRWPSSTGQRSSAPTRTTRSIARKTSWPTPKHTARPRLAPTRHSPTTVAHARP